MLVTCRPPRLLREAWPQCAMTVPRPLSAFTRAAFAAVLASARLCAPAIAAGTGDLQFIYTAFLDVPRAFQASLAACRQVDPASVPALQAAFDTWQRTQAPDQPRLRELVLDALKQQGAPDEVAEFVAQAKAATAPGGEMVADNFPTASLRAQDCEKSLPAALSGRELMINFHDYVVNWKGPTPPAGP